jgi:prephenate dehydrogenase
MSPEEHDEVAAFTQGLTHLVGRVLKEMNLEQHPMATKGFSNLFEIMNQTCNDPWQLFLDLQRYNRFTPLMREKFLQSLRTVLNAIEEEA